MQYFRGLAWIVALFFIGCASGGDRGPRGGTDAGPRADGAPGSDATAGDAGPPCLSDTECDDGVACNGAETCATDGRCAAGTPVVCDDSIGCTADTCAEPGGACTNTPDDALCAVGLVCDAIEDCTTPTPCDTDAECDDGLFCNGTETCDPAFGCRRGTAPACDDSNACNGVETCDDTAGCMPGTALVCDDGIDCTNDSCDAATGCTSTPDDTRCEDGVFCNGAETCSAATGCAAGTPPTCDDGITCTVGRCDATADACVQDPNHAFCDDSLACNGTETCDASGATAGTGCLTGVSVACDDGLSCTVDRCNEPGGTCTSMGTDADGDGYVAVGCGSGNDCNDSASAVNPGAPEVCDGIDNDCSGAADDGAGMGCALGSAPVSCTTGCGTAGTRSCNALCQLTACRAGSETCNGCDDDGDGVADNGFACVGGSSRACTTSCATSGSQSCNGTCSGYTTCVAPAEVCGNGCDDNGNGSVDEGCGPTNDRCTGAVVLSGATGTRSDTFTGSTMTVTDCASGREIWYRITLSTRSILYLDTFGSSFDTKISVRSACGASSLQCEDDDCGVLQEQLVRDLPAGTHYIGIHAFSSATTTGTVNLRWQTITPGNGSAVRFTTNGTYGGTTSGTGITSGCTGSGPENLHYFTMCPGVTRTASVTTCSLASWDTVLYIRSGGNVQIACNDDACGFQSTTSGSVSGPGLYGIYVDGWGGASGGYSINVSGL